MWIFAGLLGATYMGLILYFLRAWRRLPLWEIPPGFVPRTRVSVIIPARNEEDRIGSCLRAILRQNYPSDLFEILVIDDHSADRTADVASSFDAPNLRVWQLSQLMGAEPVASYKKEAIARAIDLAGGELILTTDADCVAPPDWIAALVSYFEAHRPAILTAPVEWRGTGSAIEDFQSLDMMGTMVLTGGGIRSGKLLLANGANLAYPKEVFQAVGGFGGIDQLASGDDMLLLQKVAARFPERIAFLKSRQVIVRTPAMPDWPSFLQQRLRWASKSGAYADRRITMVYGLVFLLSLSIVLYPLLILLMGTGVFPAFILLLGAKVLGDWWLLRTAGRFFRRRIHLSHFWTGQLFHLLYILVVGTLSFFVKRYRWKGRHVR